MKLHGLIFAVCLLVLSLPIIAQPSSFQNMTEPYFVHDPVMIKQDSTYYVFCTGRGISVLTSKDLKTWHHGKPVFDKTPQWALDAVSGFDGNIWAPDILFYHGRYVLFYAVSAFAKNTSCIGMAENKTLDPNSPDFEWVDKGKIIESIPGRDDWNAIDPNVIVDANGHPWLDFGSFWSGIKLVRLKDDLSGVAEPEQWYSLARRQRSFDLAATHPGDGAIEAPFIFIKGEYYYLFVSFDYCCRGVNSNYKVMVGRSKFVTGPYLDKDSVNMYFGGGSSVVEGNKHYPGVGHCAVYTFDGKDYIIFHGYDAEKNGWPKLIIKELSWTADGWPKLKTPLE